MRAFFAVLLPVAALGCAPQPTADPGPDGAGEPVVDGGVTDACARLNAVSSGESIVIDGDMGDDRHKQGFGCDVFGQFHGEVVDVTVSGSWTGDVRCRKCNGWVFEDLTVTDGSLRMIGGTGWTIRNSTLDGGGRGVMAVVGTGAEPDDPFASTTDWTIENITSRNAGCRPADDPFPTHVRALYLIGENGTANRGVVRGSRFEGEACGVTVKIGGTGNFGAGPLSPDAADAIVFEDNTVVNADLGDRRENGSAAVLVATNSDDVVLRGNTLVALDDAIVASGPFTGSGLVVEGNVIDAERFLLGRIYINAFGGEGFVTYDDPGPCPEVGSCSGNARP